MARTRLKNEHTIHLKSVKDGYVYDFGDDGYAAKSRGMPNQKRRQIENMIRKVDDDGLPIYYTTSPLQPWASADGAQYEPIFGIPLWDDTAEKRLRVYLGEREADEEESAMKLSAKYGAEIMAKVEEAQASMAKPAARSRRRFAANKEGGDDDQAPQL